MENYESQAYANQPDNGNFFQSKLPNATAVLVLGILSILGCCCYGVGVILGIIGLVLAKKDMRLFNANPNQYTGANNINTGRILCIIGIVLSAIQILGMIYIFAFYGYDNYQRDVLEWTQQMQQMQ